MLHDAKWICPDTDIGEICPVFRRRFSAEGIEKAALEITALGVYEAQLNGQPIGKFYLAPGWTNYKQRLQVQTYDVTALLQKENVLTVTLGKGWFRSRISYSQYQTLADGPRLLARLRLTSKTGEAHIPTDSTWEWAESPIRFSDIYDGETCDARIQPAGWRACREDTVTKEILIPQEGPPITAEERLKPVSIFRTPKGETVIDFGQEVTGWVEFSLTARAGDRVVISHGEVLDAEGNFYNENYRSAKSLLQYTCRDGFQTCRPRHSFMGFRYIRLDEFPGDPNAADFTAVVLHSQMRRTGYIRTSDPLLNRLFENVIWGQKGNFLDVPTDCPQRDERQGWLGDAQVFLPAAARNFDVKTFFKKWLRDMASEQRTDGALPAVVPNSFYTDDPDRFCSGTGWADAGVICPWALYMAYGDRDLLREQLPMMRKYVEYMRRWGDTETRFDGHFTHGDWLALDGKEGALQGTSDHDLLGNAYYARCVSLLVKALDALGESSAEYRDLHTRVAADFQNRFRKFRTQTECAVTLCFGLAENPAALAEQLAGLIRSSGNHLTTGFLGTPCLLWALSENGYESLAYDLLLRREFPSWLFSVIMGATTIWEHWDSRKADGSFWSKSMNSFNHYAYGSVADWMYAVPGGILLTEPGYENLTLKPVADPRLEFFEASVDTVRGLVKTHWHHEEGCTVYRFQVPADATVHLPGQTHKVNPGQHEFRIPTAK